jgi:predicted SnoaL-like aldol condensation-catalyzing enzyme
MTEGQIEANKEVVRRFNSDLITKGDRGAFTEIVASDFVDHSAPPENAGAEALEFFVFELLRKAIPDINVEIQDQIAEGDKVTTRKVFHGTFTSDLLGIPASNRPIAIQVIDILTVRDGKLSEHWGLNNFAQVAQG